MTQYVLDFSSRQVERRAMLHAALVETKRARHRVTPLHWSLLQWLLNLDDGCLRKSHEDMADALFTTTSTLRRAINDLAGWKLITVAEQVYATNGQGPNEYRLDWDGIRTWHARLLARQGFRIPPAQIEHPPAQFGQGGVQFGQPPVQIEQAIKEYTSSSIPSVFIPPPPPPPNRCQIREGEEAVAQTSKGDPAPAGQAPAWAAVEAKLRALGMREVATTVASARHGRMPIATCLAAIEFFEANHGAWKVGALSYFVRGWRDNLAVDDPSLWPSPDDGWRKRAYTEARGIREQGRARGASDAVIRKVMAAHNCLWFARELLGETHLAEVHA